VNLVFPPPAATWPALTGSGGELISAPPTLGDYPVILRGSKGKIREREPAALYALACDEGWPDTCGRGEAALRR
jgi:hypothetical protein